MAVAVLGFGFNFTMTLTGSLTCDDGKGKNGKVTLIYTCAVPFFVHFFAVTARLDAFSRFMKNVNKRGRRFLPLSEL